MLYHLRQYGSRCNRWGSLISNLAWPPLSRVINQHQNSERSDDTYGAAETRQTVLHPERLAEGQSPGTRGNRDTRVQAACYYLT